MKNLILSASMVFFSLFTSISAATNDEFPGRAEFPEIPLYLKAQLLNDLEKVVVVDARSKLEFETLHIKGSVNIPISSKKFAGMVKKLRSSTPKPLVFYCNGRTCLKSYKAAKAAMEAGVKKVYAYDAGIFEWATTYPEQAVLLGKSPINPKDIISKAKLKSHFLSPQDFTRQARNAPSSKRLILDVRDVYQRAGVGYFIGIERWSSLDDQKKLADYLKKVRTEKRTLYVYDQAGKQVRWLQYTLEAANIKNYYFMKKGALGFYDEFIL